MGNQPSSSAIQAIDLPIQDLEGSWYEWARIDSFFEPKGTEQARAEYKVLPNNRVDIVNKSTTGSIHGIAELSPDSVINPTSQRPTLDLTVWFDGIPFPGSYLVLGGAPTYLVIGTRQRNLLWVLCRLKPTPEHRTLQIRFAEMAVERARLNGYSQKVLDTFHLTPWNDPLDSTDLHSNVQVVE